MVHTGTAALLQTNRGGRSESLPEPLQPLCVGPNRATGEGSSHRAHTSLSRGADVQHCVVLEDAAVLEQPDLAHVRAAVVHLYVLQLDRAIPAGDVPLPLHPVPETAHRDATVAVVIKHHLLLPGHRQHQAKGAQQKGTALCTFPAQEPSDLLFLPLPVEHWLRARAQLTPTLSWKAPGCSTQRCGFPATRGHGERWRCPAATQGNLPPLVAWGRQTGFPAASQEQQGCLACPPLPPAPTSCSTAHPLVSTHLLCAGSCLAQPVHFGHRPALGHRV